MAADKVMAMSVGNGRIGCCCAGWGQPTMEVVTGAVPVVLLMWRLYGSPFLPRCWLGGRVCGRALLTEAERYVDGRCQRRRGEGGGLFAEAF